MFENGGNKRRQPVRERKEKREGWHKSFKVSGFAWKCLNMLEYDVWICLNFQNIYYVFWNFQNKLEQISPIFIGAYLQNHSELWVGSYIFQCDGQSFKTFRKRPTPGSPLLGCQKRKETGGNPLASKCKNYATTALQGLGLIQAFATERWPFF